VDSASFSWMVPLNSDMGRMSGDLIFEGQPIHPDQPPPQVDYEVATPDYFHVLSVPVLAGRVFTDRDTLDTPGVAIVNDRLAKHYWPNDNPVGHRVSTDKGKTWITVAGVVSDVHQYGLSKEAEDAIYLPVYQFDVANTHLLVRTSRDPMRLANQVAAVIHAIDPQQPVTDVRTLDQLRSAQLGTPKVTAILLGLFAVVALFITIVGVSGTLALSVARRSKEIGIRIAPGLVVGAVAAVFATRVLANLLFAVGPNDRLTFVGIAALLLLVALIGCLIPARRAVRMDPMKALRTE
jgi:hypothetical protein